MKKKDGFNIVTFKENINLEKATIIIKQLNEFLENSPSNTIVNMQSIDYISSYYILVLVSLHKKLKSNSYSMVLCQVTEPVKFILRVVGLSNVFLFSDTIEEAIESLKR